MPGKIIAAVDDMFFASKIRGTAEHLGLTVEFVKTLTAAVEAARREMPALLIADLHSQRCEPLAIAREFKSDDDLKSVSLLGFFSHVDTALQSAAQQAGFDQVMPRSAFSNNLARILSGEL